MEACWRQYHAWICDSGCLEEKEPWDWPAPLEICHRRMTERDWLDEAEEPSSMCQRAAWCIYLMCRGVVGPRSVVPSGWPWWDAMCRRWADLMQFRLESEQEGTVEIRLVHPRSLTLSRLNHPRRQLGKVDSWITLCNVHVYSGRPNTQDSAALVWSKDWIDWMCLMEARIRQIFPRPYADSLCEPKALGDAVRLMLARSDPREPKLTAEEIESELCQWSIPKFLQVYLQLNPSYKAQEIVTYMIQIYNFQAPASFESLFMLRQAVQSAVGALWDQDPDQVTSHVLDLIARGRPLVQMVLPVQEGEPARLVPTRSVWPDMLLET
jgi:hypothetical protein